MAKPELNDSQMIFPLVSTCALVPVAPHRFNVESTAITYVGEVII